MLCSQIESSLSKDKPKIPKIFTEKQSFVERRNLIWIIIIAEITFGFNSLTNLSSYTYAGT